MSLSVFLRDLSPDELASFFETDECVAWIREKNFHRVALQFPDPLLARSVDVIATLEHTLQASTRFFVLADTSYGSCCVDDVAAEHARADALIHYGDSCLSRPTERIPVKFVFGKMPVEGGQLESALRSASENGTIDVSGKSILLFDAQYAHLSPLLLNCYRSTISNDIIDCPLSTTTDSTETRISLGRRVAPDFPSWQNVTVFFVGSAQSPLLALWLLVHPNCSHVLHYDPVANSVDYKPSFSTRHLRRRLFLIESFRDARTVGIVVGTLGVHRYRDAIDRLRTLCRLAAKKVYVLSMGKVNVPKLANFSADIESFILLSCPFGIILDTSDFHRPIVSMFEAEMALNSACEWHAGMGWQAEFENLLDGQCINGQFDATYSGQIRANDDGGDVSLVSGRVRVQQVDEQEGSADREGQMALYKPGSTLDARTWRGLDDSCSPVAEIRPIEEGRQGVAAHYHREPGH